MVSPCLFNLTEQYLPWDFKLQTWSNLNHLRAHIWKTHKSHAGRFQSELMAKNMQFGRLVSYSIEFLLIFQNPHKSNQLLVCLCLQPKLWTLVSRKHRQRRCICGIVVLSEVLTTTSDPIAAGNQRVPRSSEVNKHHKCFGVSWASQSMNCTNNNIKDVNFVAACLSFLMSWIIWKSQTTTLNSCSLRKKPTMRINLQQKRWHPDLELEDVPAHPIPHLLVFIRRESKGKRLECFVSSEATTRCTRRSQEPKTSTTTSQGLFCWPKFSISAMGAQLFDTLFTAQKCLNLCGGSTLLPKCYISLLPSGIDAQVATPPLSLEETFSTALVAPLLSAARARIRPWAK